MIIMWVLQVLLAITVEVIESKVKLILAGWRKDIEGVKKIGKIFKRDGDDDSENEIDDSAELAILQERVDKTQEEKEEKRAQRKKKAHKNKKSKGEKEKEPVIIKG